MKRSALCISLLASFARFAWRAHAADPRRDSTPCTRNSGKKISSSTRSPPPSPAIRATTPSCRTSSLPSSRSVEAFQKKYLDRARAIGTEGLSGQDRLSYDIFTLNRESALEDSKFPERLLPIDQFYNIANSFAQLGSGTSAQPFETVKDYDDWLKRAAQRPAIFDQAIVNMREGVKAGIVQPRVLMEKVLPQLDANIVDDAEKSIFWGPIANMPKEFSAADRERLTAAFRTLIATQLMPAYQRLHAYIADEYLPKTRDTFGMGALPNGAAWYAHKVHDNTTRSMTPAQVHQIGLDEVARIQDGMRAVAKDLGYAKPTKIAA